VEGRKFLADPKSWSSTPYRSIGVVLSGNKIPTLLLLQLLHM